MFVCGMRAADSVLISMVRFPPVDRVPSAISEKSEINQINFHSRPPRQRNVFQPVTNLSRSEEEQTVVAELER